VLIRIQQCSTPITTKSYDDICSLFDEVDLFLRSGPTKYGVRFAESGLDLPFDAKSISRYRSASASDEDFERFVEYVGYMADLSINILIVRNRKDVTSPYSPGRT